MRAVPKFAFAWFCFQISEWKLFNALSFKMIFENVVCGYLQTDADSSDTLLIFGCTPTCVFILRSRITISQKIFSVVSVKNLSRRVRSFQCAICQIRFITLEDAKITVLCKRSNEFHHVVRQCFNLC